MLRLLLSVRRCTLAATLVATAALGAGCGGGSSSPSSAGPSIPSWDVTGYLEAGGGGFTDVVAKDRGVVSTIAVDGSSVTADGRGIADPDTDAEHTAAASGATTELLVSNFDDDINDFSADLGSLVLDHPDNRAAVIAAIVSNVTSEGWRGVTVDFESLKPSDRHAFTAFVRQLRDALPSELRLVVDVPADPDPTDPYVQPYDEAALAGEADEIALMAYDQHYQGGPAGPVAGIDWVKASLAVTLRSVPADKVQLAMAGYGYRWHPGGRTDNVTDAQARAACAAAGVPPTWVATQGEWQATLPDGSVLWWSDTRSQALDVALARQKGLRGVALWEMGSSDPLSPSDA